ncbi:uncharacterized protein MELLADRAFT_116558 [Melampsora larici-populina 98AG31]|uniref:Uncharacterized protein n=1 Tax=Melampsora larici-populina (strain 98AG31 / pathotype 3-4-7) TaxID=747676 RepID=F4RMN1_MELLP|nr:uncharacterized protein MELLADRAFT_116558 [Melampsora larici-populina 98AG31]EGG06141.1 hypothetical protein MELLADRAFT_116558 [Melampsora larici-populina 98AG31]
MFANTAPSGASGGVIGLHTIHNSGTALGSLGAHSNTHNPQQLQQLQQQTSTPAVPSGNSTMGPNSGGPATGDLNGAQPSRRPSGLPLYNVAAQNGLPHYLGYGQSSSAPLPSAGPAAPIHPSHTLQRTTSFSFNSPHLPSQHLSSTPASAPPSATLPPSNRSPSMSAPAHNTQAPANHAHSQGRSSLPPSLPGQCGPNVNAALTSADSSRAQPVPLIARSATSTDAMSLSGSAAKRNPSNGACHSPGTLSNLGISGHPPAGSQPGPSSMGVSSAPGCGSSSADASRFFNTYLYDYLLKQGLFEVAQVFVTSGAEIELMENAERSGLAEMANVSSSQKQDRSDSSPNDGPSSSPPQPTSNGCLTQVGAPNGIMKNGTAASEPVANERTLSSSGSIVSNTSHYGFNHIAGSRSGAANDASNGQSSITDQTPNGVGASASAGTSNTSMGSPRSSPRIRHLTLENLPKPKLAMDTDQGFLFEWWTIFWDVFRAKTGRGSNTQPAQMYAHSVAAASLGMSLEAGTPKARRDAVGLVAVANPDIQRGQLGARMQQPYTLMDSQMHLAHHAEHPPASAVRLQPHPHMTPQQKHQLLLEHNARQHQQQQQVLLQQQQQHIQQQQLQHHHQAQMAARQRLYQHEMQQQQQQEAHLQQQQQSHQQQHHQAQQLHQQMYSEQFPGGQMGALHRQMSINGRRVAGMGPPGQDHLSNMMPPPPVQHGSPLNPHQQPPYRPSRPPSRSGVPHVSSPFAGNAGQPPREPSRASNHANSPAAFQNNPRTPGSHCSAVTPQAAVLPPHRRGSPGAAEDQDRKKRRLNDNPGHQPAESLHANNQSQQAQQAQQQMQHMHMQQLQHRQQMMGSNASTPVPASQGSPPNMNHTPHQSMDAYKQAVHAQHAQGIAAPNVANQMVGNGPNPAGNVTPAKANGAKTTDNNMPPPAGRNFHQPPTPQATPNGTRPGDEHATPLPTIVTPSPDRSQSNQSNRLVNQPEGKTEASEGTPHHQPSPMTLPPGQTSDDSQVNGDASGRPNSNSDETPSQGDIKVQQSTHEGNQDLWLMGNSQGTQQMKGMLGESSDSPTNAQPSGDIAVSSNNPIEQLFNGDGLNGDTSGLDFDATLFEAFINYDPTTTTTEYS